MKINLIIIVTIAFSIISCSKSVELDTKREYNLFDSIPTNLGAVNSEYDDYNSAWPSGIKGITQQLTFSSNRNSNGGNFDFVTYIIAFLFDTETDTLVRIEGFPILESNFKPNSLVNTPYDEFGPYYWKSSWSETKYAFMYSTNEGGNQDIKFLLFHDSDTIPNFINLETINTEYNEMYPSISDSEFYFTSDRTGNFDIYSTDILKDNLFNSDEFEFSADIKRIDPLSGPYDDKCPIVDKNLMVFTSNRTGGYGGFDLWYSIKSNNEWSEPINFGENINTEFDEYRPIIIPFVDTDLMIFSSNRPGGLGGFDLYYVGILNKRTGHTSN